MSVFNKTLINAIDKAFATEAKTMAATIAATNGAIQKAVDAMIVACKVSKAEFMKGNAKTNEARAEVKGLFEGLASDGHFNEKTAQQYASCFWIAFETGKVFSRDALNKKSAAGREPKAGEVTTTTFEALIRTLQKALKQARMLDQDEFASDLLDVIDDHVDGFEEVTDTEQ